MASKAKAKSVSASSFSREPQRFLTRAAEGKPVRVKVNGKGSVEILSEKRLNELRRRARLNHKFMEWLESWNETQEILADQVMMDAIRRSEEDVKAGRLLTLDEVRRHLPKSYPIDKEREIGIMRRLF